MCARRCYPRVGKFLLDATVATVEGDARHSSDLSARLGSEYLGRIGSSTQSRS
jgi:hypothetical protein